MEAPSSSLSRIAAERNESQQATHARQTKPVHRRSGNRAYQTPAARCAASYLFVVLVITKGEIYFLF